MYKVRTHRKCQCLCDISHNKLISQGVVEEASFVYHSCFCRILFTCERRIIYCLSVLFTSHVLNDWLQHNLLFNAAFHSTTATHSLCEHGCLEHMVSIVPNNTLNDTAGIKCHV